MTVINNLIGTRGLVLYLAGIVFSALAFCFATDWLYSLLALNPKVSIAAAVEFVPGWLELPSAVVLLVLLAYGIHKERIRPLMKRFRN